MKKHYIIIHGSFGSPKCNWFPWLKNELEEKGNIVDVPQMLTGVEVQDFDSWSMILKKLDIDENTIIIAHSIACVFICKYLIVNEIKVKKLIFVSGFNDYLGINLDIDTVNVPMYIDNYYDVKKYCNNIICYYSDNDPYVEYKVEKEFADNVATKQYVIHNGGHLNEESGYLQFKEILKSL